jgi:3-oxoacyl-(acyl-carrier-protein) synthase
MTTRVNIIGAEAINALGADLSEIWDRMMGLECGITPLVNLPKGKYQTGVAGEVLPEIENRLPETGCDSRLFRLAAAAAAGALRQAESADKSFDREHTGLVFSTTKAGIDELEKFIQQKNSGNPQYLYPGAVAAKLAVHLSLGGPAVAVSCACASGLAAIVQAARMLRDGSAARMLVVGADILSDFVMQGFSSLQALSERPCRPYDRARDGMSLGEGAGALVMTAGENPEALASVGGWGITNDCTHINVPDPGGRGLRKAVEAALAMSGKKRSEIGCINGHGTSTIPNDEMEAEAIAGAFGENPPPLSSMKGYFGHTMGAGGVIETAINIKALEKNIVPACLGFAEKGVGPALNICREHLERERLDNILTIKSGFGGINAAVIISVRKKGN